MQVNMFLDLEAQAEQDEEEEVEEVNEGDVFYWIFN